MIVFFFSGIFHFLSENKAVGVMKPGHTFTIEPMISQGLCNSFFDLNYL